MEELKATKRQRVRDILKHPEREELLDETYDELESNLLHKIEGIQNQLQMAVDKRNAVIRANRLTRAVVSAINGILAEGSVRRDDLLLLVEKIMVYEDRIDVRPKEAVRKLLCPPAISSSGDLG